MNASSNTEITNTNFDSALYRETILKLADLREMLDEGGINADVFYGALKLAHAIFRAEGVDEVTFANERRLRRDWQAEYESRWKARREAESRK